MGRTRGRPSSSTLALSASSFNVDSFTKTESVPELIDVALAEVAKMKAKGPTTAEVATVQRYIAAMLTQDLARNRKSQACALGTLRRNERLEDVSLDIGRDAGAIILHHDLCPPAIGFQSCRHGKVAIGRFMQRIQGITDDVQQSLVQPFRVNLHRFKLRVKLLLYRNVQILGTPFNQFEHQRHDRPLR